MLLTLDPGYIHRHTNKVRYLVITPMLLALDPGYIHRHTNKVYAHGNAINISRGTWSGVKAAFFGLQVRVRDRVRARVRVRVRVRSQGCLLWPAG
tara:strand:+ start:421 stop:705 length:285 start_codon:yes stop_codon:yes gene_type:complete